MKRFALAGNPNSGKTTLFNGLTGSTAHVGNWPGVTVDKREGTYKKLEEPIQIVDLPGIYSLSPYTSEEVISRNYLLEEKPDCVINIVDATNLERNLYLTTQVMEIDVPVIIALNMMDVLKKEGRKIDAAKLEKQLGVPVVEISALREENLDELMTRAYATSKVERKGISVLEESKLAHLVNDVQIAFKGAKVDNALFHAIKLVEKDEIEEANHPQLIEMVDEFKESFQDEVFGTDLEAVVADARYKYITKHFGGVISKEKVDATVSAEDEKFKLSISDKIDRVLTNKWAGLPIFAVILFLIFHLTFAENFLYLGPLFANIDPSFAGTPFEGVIWNEGGLMSPVMIIFNLVGCLCEWFNGWVDGLLVGAPLWVQSFIVDGVLAGLTGVLSFIPQIMFLFLFFSILEDTGYMARVAFILDRIFRRFGLSGRAFMPMIMGFGCSIPAMANTRTLADDDERTATIRVIPFFSCGAKLPILTAVAGSIVTQFGVGNADAITFGMYWIGIAVAIISVILMRNTTMRGEVPPFIMELPAYHAPQFKSLMIHMWDKIKHYVKKAFTIILASSIIIWFLSSFTWNYNFLVELIEDERVNLQMDKSILAGIGQLFTPIFTPLGFGSNLSQTPVAGGGTVDFTWIFVVAAVTGLIAKENVIATFGILAACVTGSMIGTDEGIEEVAAMIQATGITIPGLISFIVFNLTTIPCFAAVATAKGELPTKKSYHGTIIFWLAASYISSAVVFVVGTWWWTCFIFLAAAVGIGYLIHLYNKAHPVGERK